VAIQKHRSNTSKAQNHGGNAKRSAPSPRKSENVKRYAIVMALVAASFFGAYQFAHAQSGTDTASAAVSQSASTGAQTGVAQLSGGVQQISVDVGRVYTPSVVRLKAGVPAEITFSGAQGCTAIVQSSDLGFQEDLSAGPKTVKLNGLAAGTYNFACGMNMVRGQIVVE
jgi:plastocyanin domain-containing protein